MPRDETHWVWRKLAAAIRRSKHQTPIRAFQICNGVGSGNIGDEMMARAFWDQLPSHVRLAVAVLPNHSSQHDPYPEQHRYVPVEWEGNERAGAPVPGLLVGDTPVADSEGLSWPMRFISKRLQYYHDCGLAVDAVGVGVDHLTTLEGKALFTQAYSKIRSWTVRSPRCRGALMALGVSADRIRVGADLAWLYQRRQDLRGWAATVWRALGIDINRPLLVANVVNMIWRQRGPKEAIAAALDTATRRYGLQIAFFCNECRDGDFFDFAAAKEIRELMRERAVIVPNKYYSPDEVLGLLSHATVTLSQRYHFAIETVVAGSVPINVVRGQKMQGLSEELGLAPAGDIDSVDREVLLGHVARALNRSPSLLRQLSSVRDELRSRAEESMYFVRRYLIDA